MSSTVHLPIILVGFLVYLNVCYWALGLPHEYAKFFIFSGIGLMSTLMGYSLAQTLSAAMSTPQVRLLLLFLFLSFFLSCR